MDLFSTGFENGDLGAWLTDGNVSVHAGQVNSGGLSMRLRRSASAALAISTQGHSDITLEYAKRTKKYDGGEALLVQWSSNGGATWQTIEEGNTNWAARSFLPPADAGDNFGFVLRFATTADANNESPGWTTSV